MKLEDPTLIPLKLEFTSSGAEQQPVSAEPLSPSQKEIMEARAASQEREIARAIQQRLFPAKLPAPDGFQLAGSCISASDVGGDYYDAISVGPGAVMLVIADVMGCGMTAALYAAKLRTLVRTAVDWGLSPAKLLTSINQVMFFDLSGTDTFITAQVLLVDTTSRQLLIANAGHCPLLLADAGSGLQALAPDGLPIGVLHDSPYTDLAMPLEVDGRMLLYTDGITEASDPGRNFFGQDRLEEWFGIACRQQLSAAEIKLSLQLELRKFQDKLPPQDDQTFLVMAPTSTERGGRLPTVAQLR